jgi:hypothetical protein
MFLMSIEYSRKKFILILYVYIYNRNGYDQNNICVIGDKLDSADDNAQ